MGDDGLPGRLVEFVSTLRSKGIGAGTGETVDAADVIRVLGMSDRRLLREGLAAALLRGAGQRDVFDAVFDLYFPAGAGRPESARDAADELDPAALRELLTDAIAAGDETALNELAGIAVDRFGSTADSWSGYITLERLQPQTLLAGALERRGRAGGLTGRLQPDELRGLIGSFRRMVQAEARRRSAEVRGRERIAADAVQDQLERLDFLSADTAQLAELRRVVRPLARRLSTRLATRRRRRDRGRIDIRKTLRRSMSTGGVPMDVTFEKPHRTRPELVLLCDVSGSVSGFSNFTMLLVQAMKSQFSRIRVFAFVNAMDEVTDLVDDDVDLQRRIHSEAKVTRLHGSSDYGTALTGFVDDYLDAVGPRTSVLVLGDARTNYGRARVEALEEIAGRARRIFWLNPERTSSWGTGDSVAPVYSAVVEMHECRTVEQLSEFVTRLLPI